jgi:hypothetical protein
MATSTSAGEFFRTFHAETGVILAALTAAHASHFDVDLKNVNWAHVGDIASLLDRLRDAAAFIGAAQPAE